MADNGMKTRNLIFFYHKNHNDRFNGTSVYDKAMLKALDKDFNITAVEPDLTELKADSTVRKNTHYFVNMVKQVYFRQIQWLINIFRGKHLTPPENTILLVEDIYCAPIPLLVSKLKGYRLIFRVADFGKAYSSTLFENNPFDSFVYSIFRRIMEKFMVMSSSLIICPSRSVESAVVRRYPSSGNRVVFLPYVRTDLFKNHKTQESEVAPITKDRKVVLLFMGDFRYPPNHSAGNYLVNDLVPKLKRHSGEYEVHIAGQNSKMYYTDTADVKVLGTVGDIEDLFSTAQIGLAPMRTIGGLSMKIVDYLTHGLRVVATPEAANGVEANGQMKLVDFPDFHKVVEEEIVNALDDKYAFHEVSDPVSRVYMTSKWQKNLLNRLNEISLDRNKDIRKSAK